MRILALGDSWTYGVNSSDPATMSWPAQMAKKYNVEVVNLASPGSSNQRAARIGIEELCKDSNYDYVVLPLAPASRTEILNNGKWHQIFPNHPESFLDKIYMNCWHPFNDVQNTILLTWYFSYSLKSLGIPLYMSGLSLCPSQYTKQIKWITDYKNNNDFNSLDMPLEDFNIGIQELDQQLRSLKAVHLKNLELQPEYFNDIVTSYLMMPEIQKKYSYSYDSFTGHPNDAGYSALADYFAGKIGLI
jgi:lysophospholipase L1-like esterase